jgi:hypothetical protein
MKTRLWYMPLHNPRLRLWLAVILAVIILALAFGKPQPTAADAGGWPTATPTWTAIPIIIIPTSTPEPTLPFLPFPSTPTHTPGVPGFVEGQAIPQVELRVETTPAPPGFTVLSCWPFALIVLIIAAAGILWVRARLRTGLP